MRPLLRTLAGTEPGTRRVAVRAVSLAVTGGVLGASLMGCGVIGQVSNVVDSASTLSTFADRLGKSADLTFTATYKSTDGGTVTLVQEPPNSAFIGPDGRYVFTPDHMLFCEKNTCTSAPSAGTGDAGAMTAATGPGFVTPELALGFVTAAAVIPGADIESEEREIAGQNSLCATATGLEAVASPGDGDAPRDFSVCVTETGVLASFTGTLASGEKASIELVSFKDEADAKAFEAPEGAEIAEATGLPTT
ncbi:hypothetical protein GCM10023194_57950 [Planotetraspora phitsanulokensis]|uniref:Lipoprotein n=1 Tax=Planotetraspora phitsanulokensis TaxID=575192 RepID=A0A8J3U7R9_9ACTN|nr:hypothetical protein [Planotetraspora phitsanulokensis]GII40258.1 hypothetical protein Pph01_52610 [Planotetraspora phitsanulokensis]